ncbi:hypothetical protein TNCV_1909601 [Trichonephila clavipes]|nr:hypothetical protein TNCV_1909601 [Trichonephila clavipes]
MGRHLRLDKFHVHQPPLHGESSATQGSNASNESVTLTTRLPRPKFLLTAQAKSTLISITVENPRAAE